MGEVAFSMNRDPAYGSMHTLGDPITSRYGQNLQVRGGGIPWMRTVIYALRHEHTYKIEESVNRPLVYGQYGAKYISKNLIAWIVCDSYWRISAYPCRSS